GRLPRLQPPDARRHEGARRARFAGQGARLQARRLRRGDRPVSTTVREVRREAARASYAPRLKVMFEQELRAGLKDELGLSSVMDVPELQKITLNMGVGEAKTDAKQLDSALEELTIIAGQRAQV